MKNAIVAISAATLAAITSCGSSHDQPSPSTSTSVVKAQFDQYEDRLVSMLDEGWVVSRDDAGAIQHAGDALIWSGVALGTLSCAAAAPIEGAMIEMLQENGGKLYRHPTLKDQVSIDGAIGLYFGISRRIARCDGALSTWSDAAAKNPGFGADPLNVDQAVNLTPEWTVLRELLEAKLAGGAAPSPKRQAALEGEVASWAGAVNASHSACYRVNLGWLTMKTLEELRAPPSNSGRDAFCFAARGLDLPLVQNYCGDAGAVSDYIASFKENEWEFRHQRCAGWETPDGHGLQTPALDLLMALRETYQI